MTSVGAHPSWPEPLLAEAHHGLAGEFVRTIGPHTESDPAALLIQFLVAVGNVIGKGPHWQAEADRHWLNLFTVLVGDTSKSRKGSSWAHVRKLVAQTDPIWTDHCIQTGLSSGEGLIHAVCDPVRGDLSPFDPRLLVVESEFASPLRMTTRDGNTLSPVVRQAWDGLTLQVITKQSPEKASSAHVSIIGHITSAELTRELNRVDAGSGFGNRFLWVCVRRSKVLPEGGQVPQDDFERLAALFTEAVGFARDLGNHEIRRTDDARELWYSRYEELSKGKRGLFGAVTSRAEAQVMRIACLYALLDKSPEVRPEHLRAGLAVWKYC